ncbi:MAG: flippase [Minisyncoccia bacterium]
MYKSAHKYIKEKIEHPGFQKYTKNMGWAFASRVFSLIISFFIGALIARYLGPERYGSLNYVLSFVTIFAFLSSFGIDNILARDIIKEKEKTEEILNTAFTIKLFGSLLVFIIIIFFSFFVINRNDNYINILIFIYSLQFLTYPINVIDTYFQAIAKNKYLFISQFFATVVVSGLKLFLIFQGFGVGWFIIALVVEALVYSLIILYIFQKNGHRLKFKINLSLTKKMLSDSWPFILNSAFFLIYSRIDQIIIKKMMNNEALGLYSAGVKPAEIWYFIPLLICSSFFPALVNAKISDEKVYENRVKKIFFLIVGISVFIALFEFIFAEYIILLLFGSNYSGAVEVLKIYTWAGVAISIVTVLSQYLVIENKAKTIMISSSAGAIVNIFLNLWFIPIWGIIGSAYATLLSYSIIPLFIWLFSNSGRKNIRKIFLKLAWPFFKLGKKNYWSTSLIYYILEKINKLYLTSYLKKEVPIEIPTGKYKKDVLLICVSFNDPSLIQKQIELFKKNLSANHVLIIADNSSLLQKRIEIKEICKKENIYYLDLPKNPRRQANLSHSLALNWIYYNFVLKVEPFGFGFIDHDIFSTKNANIKNLLEKYDLYGLKQERQKNNFTAWYLWAGFCFYRYSYIKQFKPNFDSMLVSDGHNHLELDTGGGNYRIFYENSGGKVLFAKQDINRKNGEEIIDEWYHIGKASSKTKEEIDIVINSLPK